MKNLKDAKTMILPSKTRGGKELPSSSALDSPSIISKLAIPPHAINPDMSQVIDDATSSMNDTYDDASTLLNDDVPLDEFLDEQIARVRQHDIVESDDELETENLETPIRTSLLDMNCQRYRKVTLSVRRQLEIFFLVRIEMI